MHERYNDNHYHHGMKKNHFGRNLLVFLLFIAVLGVIFFTTIYEGSITGNSVRNVSASSSVEIYSETNIPGTSLTGYYPKITFEILSNQELKLEGKKILLDKTSNLLILEEFSGELQFDENSINLLKGKTSKIYINGVPISNDKDVKMRVSIDSGVGYNSIAFKNENAIKEINFMCTGKVNFGQDSIVLNQDNCIFGNAVGEFSVKDKKLIFRGYVTSLSIKGENKKLSISK